MKKKIDRCKYNLNRGYGVAPPYCGWIVLSGFKKEDCSFIFPPHVEFVLKYNSKLNKTICKNCKCFEPITRS